MLEFRTNSVQRFCPSCHQSFMVAPTPNGYKQSCPYCGIPLVDDLRGIQGGPRK